MPTPSQTGREHARNGKLCARGALWWVSGLVGLAAASYAAYAGSAWYRYGKAKPADGEAADATLDKFMPAYEVAERHYARVAAPAELALSAACDLDLLRSPIIRSLFRGREAILGSEPERTAPPRGLLAMVKSLGWIVLDEVPGREIVVGAVTQPWCGDVKFHSPAPEDFAGFHEPGYVKIVWTLRADPTGPAESIVRTETRAAATDPTARARFRRYWSFFSPGIVLIRKVGLGLVKREAERRAQAGSGRVRALRPIP